ncbi:MAG: glycogen/starch/alpha-glucan family phosphorylase, partial [Planctomycetes bacterium]|nr:glycogen/starch/alpha-glucan family phosphorylase [Planctomycetota bacterium]
MSDSMSHPHEPLGASLRRHLRHPDAAHTPTDLYHALVRALREPLLRAHHATEERYRAEGRKRVHYLSAEFLVGRLLRDTLQNLGLYEEARAAVAECGGSLADVLEAERDPGLGSGGLGRLAACYLESAASTGVPVFGHGLDYEYGLFRQVLVDGRQTEAPDTWRAKGSPWLVGARGGVREVPLYGRVDARREATRPGGWLDAKLLLGEARELPVAGRGGATVHTLRLYRARAAEPFDMAAFQAGDHLEAARGQVEAERVTKLLYPSESTPAGRELRLVQEYFLVSCAVQDVLEQHLAEGHPLEELPVRAAFQLNDTHPALAIAELLRLLVDEHGVEFGRAAALCRDTFAYTNHTLLPEALERWPRPLLLHVLPRHLRLIEQLNALFLAEVEARWPGDIDRLRRMSIIEEGSPKHVRMAHLAIVSSYAVNGVSALHSDLMQRQLVPDFAELWPDRFHNVTNGISHRRWLLGANPGLARLVTERIGEGWIDDLGALRELEAAADDPGFGEAFLAVKRENKAALAAGLEGGAFLDLDGLFDVQVKRIHEYKRQSLAALYAVHLYLRLVEDGWRPPCARTMLFAGKAAPDYRMAKEILAFLVRLSEVVNRDG